MGLNCFSFILISVIEQQETLHTSASLAYLMEPRQDERDAFKDEWFCVSPSAQTSQKWPHVNTTSLMKETKEKVKKASSQGENERMLPTVQKFEHISSSVVPSSGCCRGRIRPHRVLHAAAERHCTA
mmetsp:Transcript_8154/g.21619  ORF Transcript_8154/g.21619 Transcript_8154/m.21619 type:complete len:127 (-) Transcript_8154:868-1248(-)